MIWNIVVKLRNSGKLSIAEEKELKQFFERVLRVKILGKYEEDNASAQDKDNAQAAVCEFLNTLSKGGYDATLKTLSPLPDRNEQLSFYIIRALKNGVLHELENESSETDDKMSLTKDSPAEDGDGDEYEMADESEDTEGAAASAVLADKFAEMLENILDFIEKKDGRAGEIKRIYKRDPRYLEQKSRADKEWVREVTANNKIEEEGDLAVNFMLFFIWWWNEEVTEDGLAYGLQEYIDYVSGKTGGKLVKITSTEYDRKERILEYIGSLFKENSITEKDMDFATLFLHGLAEKFEERKPEILEKNPENEF